MRPDERDDLAAPPPPTAPDGAAPPPRPDDGGGHLDEGTIHAWLDDALPAADAARVEAHARACPACAALVAEARGLLAAASRILGALDDERSGVTTRADEAVAAAFAAPAAAAAPVAAGDEVPVRPIRAAGAARRASGRPIRAVPRWIWRTAAGVLVAAGAGALVLRETPAPELARMATEPMAAEARRAPAPAAASDASPPAASDAAGALGTADVAAPSRDPADTRRKLAAPVESAERMRRAATAAEEQSPGAATPPAEQAAGPLARRAYAAGSEPAPAPVAVPPSAPAARASTGATGAPAPAAAAPPPPARRAASAPPAMSVVRGVVVAPSGEPVRGATVVIVDGAVGVVTDSAGRFTLPVESARTRLRVRSIGYEGVTIAAGAADSLRVVLQPSALALSSVVVSGSDATPSAAATIEAWLDPAVPRDDVRVPPLARCWALVDGRVPGGDRDLMLRLRPEARRGGSVWTPLGADSVRVALDGAGELRLAIGGAGLVGLAGRPGPDGPPRIPLAFAAVRCPD